MRSLAILLALLVTSRSTLAQPVDPDRPPLVRGNLTGYPWKEEAEVVRVPKGLLRYFDFVALDFPKNPESPKWTVADLFVQVCALSPAESEALSRLVNEAVEAQRHAEGRHLKPVEGRLPMGSYREPSGLTVLDERTFLLEPHQQVLDEIEGNLRAAVLRLLGNQRREELWRKSVLAWLFHPTTSGSESLTFRLIELRSTRSIDLVRVSGGGSSGGPHFEEADRYAPESLKPVLKRWRSSIAEYRRTNAVAGADGGGAAAGNVHAEGEKAAVVQGETFPVRVWDERSDYVEFPRSLIPGLGLPSLRDDAITPEAEVLFGFTAVEAETVNNLFREYRGKFEVLEAAHFSRKIPGGDRFELRRFPDQAKSLGDEWLLRLKGLVGNQRGRLLDLCLRETEAEMRRQVFHRGPGRRSSLPGWPIWLLRGRKSFEFTATFQKGPEGRFSLELRDLDDPEGFQASQGGPMRGFPAELRHLFLLEGLEPGRRAGLPPL